jgi:hypothetical protein
MVVQLQSSVGTQPPSLLNLIPQPLLIIESVYLIIIKLKIKKEIKMKLLGGED